MLHTVESNVTKRDQIVFLRFI